MNHPIFDEKYKTEISFEMYKNLSDLPKDEKILIYNFGFPYFTILVCFVTMPFLLHIIILALSSSPDINTKFLHSLLLAINICSIALSYIIYKIKGKVQFNKEEKKGDKNSVYKFI